MAEAASSLCTLCQEDDLTFVAVCWCTDCETFLCAGCEKHHSKIKSSKHHVTINVEEYHNLPSFILNTSNRCEDHDFRYEFYCKFHDRVCCIKCTADMHNKCRDIQPISEVFENIKSSSSMLDSENRLKLVLEDFDTVRTCLSNRIILLQSQKDKFVMEVDLFRKSFLNLLDRLQKQFLDELNKEHDLIKVKTDILLVELKDKETRLKNLQDDFIKMRRHATNLQTHLGLRVVEQVTEDEIQFLQKLQNDQQLDNTSIEFKITSKLHSFLIAENDTLGRVSVVKSPKDLKLKSEGSMAMQQPVSTWNLDDKTKPKLLRSYPILKHKSATTGCQILPDGKMVSVGRTYKFLAVFKDWDKFDKRFLSLDSPQDVCYVKENIVAVTYPCTGKVSVVNITNNVVINEIPVEKCGAIDSDGETIAVSTMDNIIFLKHDSGEIGRIAVSQVSHVALFNNNVYYTNRVNDTIACQNMDGRIVWENKYEEALKPAGIALDKDGYIYVACEGSKNVVVVSPDGRQCRILLSKADGLKHPYALSIDRKSSKLLVCQLYNKTAFIFETQ